MSTLRKPPAGPPAPGDVKIWPRPPGWLLVGIGRRSRGGDEYVKWFMISESELRLLRGRTDELLETTDQTERAS
jgi:hypothetical protein